MDLGAVDSGVAEEARATWGLGRMQYVHRLALEVIGLANVGSVDGCVPGAAAAGAAWPVERAEKRGMPILASLLPLPLPRPHLGYEAGGAIVDFWPD